MTSIAVDEQTADILRELQERARLRQMTFNSYLRELGRMDPPNQVNQLQKLERFKDILPELEARTEVATASLPADFSREDIYSDHD